MFLKNAAIVGNNVKGQMVSLGGVRMQDGCTWKTASTLVSRTIKITDDCLDLGQLSTLKSFQITSSHNNRTTSGSVIPLLTNAATVDLQSSALITWMLFCMEDNTVTALLQVMKLLQLRVLLKRTSIKDKLM